MKNIYCLLVLLLGFPMAQQYRTCLPVQEIWVWSLGREDPLEKEMATHTVFLTGESHGERILVGYSSWGHKRVRHVLETKQQQSPSSGYNAIFRTYLKNLHLKYWTNIFFNVFHLQTQTRVLILQVDRPSSWWSFLLISTYAVLFILETSNGQTFFQ